MWRSWRGVLDVDVCEVKSHKKALMSGVYVGYGGQELNRNDESFVIPIYRVGAVSLCVNF